MSSFNCSIARSYDDQKADSHCGRHFLGECGTCGQEFYGRRRPAAATGLKSWQCSTCGKWGCEECLPNGGAHICECGKQYCSGCIEKVDDLWLCAECKPQHLLELQGIFSPEVKQSAALAWAYDRIFDQRRAA